VAFVLLIASALAADCDLDAALDSARDTVLQLDFDAASERLRDVEREFGRCPAEAEQVARFWLASGALEAFQGDEEARDEALVAAKAANVSFWDPVWGDELQEAWANASASGAPASLRVLDVPPGYVVRVDGTVRVRPEEVAVDPGLHVVQAFAKEVGFGRVVRAAPGADVSIETDLVELPREAWASEALVPEIAVPRPVPEPPPTDRGSEERVVALTAGLGLGVWGGPSFELDGVREAGTKFLPAVEVGIWVAPSESFWIRGAIGAEIALGTRFVYFAGEVGQAEGRSLPVAPVLHVAAGTQLGGGPIGVGGLVGMQLPSRVPLRAVGRYSMGRFAVEARLGANLLGVRSEQSGVQTGRVRLEPAIGALGTFTL
jgi:hypothetical protein